MPKLDITEEEREELENALGEYMSDEYGEDNEEGCFEPAHWAMLQVLAEKILQAK